MATALTTHTTINLSSPLINEAQRLFKGKTKTEIIHEALQRMVRAAKMQNHIKKYAGKGKFVNYDPSH